MEAQRVNFLCELYAKYVVPHHMIKSLASFGTMHISWYSGKVYQHNYTWKNVTFYNYWSVILKLQDNSCNTSLMEWIYTIKVIVYFSLRHISVSFLV